MRERERERENFLIDERKVKKKKKGDEWLEEMSKLNGK